MGLAAGSGVFIKIGLDGLDQCSTQYPTLAAASAASSSVVRRGAQGLAYEGWLELFMGWIIISPLISFPKHLRRCCFSPVCQRVVQTFDSEPSVVWKPDNLF